MGDTFLQLQTDCLDYAYNEADRTRFKAFINDAYMDLFSRRRWAWAEATTSVNLSSGASSAAMPTMSSAPYHFGRIQKVTSPSTGYVVPTYVDYTTEDPISWVDAAVTESGVPTEYTIWDDTIYFNRLANQAYTYQYAYWAQPTRMSADGDEPGLPDYMRELLRWGALKRHAARERDWTSVQQFAALEQGAYEAAVAADAKDRSSKYAQMPAGYYGGYDGQYR